jgi:hypothetical protein
MTMPLMRGRGQQLAAIIFALAALVTALGGPQLLDRMFGPVPPAMEALNVVRTGDPGAATPQPLLRITGDAVEFAE